LTKQNVLAHLFHSITKHNKEKTMKKIGFVLAVLAATAFALPVATAEAGILFHHHHHHHH
jgi:Na+/proline symporter